MEEKLLEIKDLSVEYTTDEDIVKAVNHVSLTLNKGETIGLVGETGAGKTTLALSLMRLLPKVSGRITGGEIMFNGEDLVKAAEEDMRKVRGEKISMIFQDPMTSLNPVLTVGNQIGEALELHMDLTPEEKQERIEEMLKLVGIAESRKKDYPISFPGV
jgi:peptide/nickel transport system ATP-binding protein